MYWIFTNRLVDQDNDADLSGETNIELGGQLSFEEGVSNAGIKIPKITLTLDSDSHLGNMTDHLSISETYGLVFSSRLRELFGNIGVENIEYYDFEIVNPKNGKKYSDYKIANVVGLVDCVDTEKSDLKYFDDGDIKRIRKMFLDESKIPPELRVFRLTKMPIVTVVHQSIKDAITEAGITGCVFRRPEEYR